MKTLIKLLLFSVTMPALLAQHNIVKINLSSVSVGNVYVSYEKAFTKKLSFQLGLSYIPEKNMPFGESFPSFNNNASPLKQTRLEGFSITPELRLYTSLEKVSPKGLYIAPYFRYSQYQFNCNGYEYKYTDTYNENKKVVSNIDFSGNALFVGAGIMIGHQWIVGKHLSVDLWILGIGISHVKFNIKASSDNMDYRYFQNGSKFSDEIINYLKALDSVKIVNGSNYMQATSNRLLPMLRGLGANFGVFF